MPKKLYIYTLKFILTLFFVISTAFATTNFKSNNIFATNTENTLATANPATMFKPEEIIEITNKNFENNFDKNMLSNNKNFIIIDACGGFGLQDPYSYTREENEKLTATKANDAAYLFMYKLMECLAPTYNVIITNDADISVKKPPTKHDKYYAILPNITPTNAATYEKYYSGSNKQLAISTFIDLLEKTYNKNNSSKQPICCISIQLGSNSWHCCEGMRAFSHSTDTKGKRLGQLILDRCKFLITKTTSIKGKGFLEESDDKIMLSLGKKIPTVLLFLDYEDNKKMIHKLFDTQALNRMAQNVCHCINLFYDKCSNYADVDINLVQHDSNNENVEIKVAANIIKSNIKNQHLKSWSIALTKAKTNEPVQTFENLTPLTTDDNNLKIEKNFNFNYNKPENELANCFNLKIYAENEKNEKIEFATNVTNFKISKNSNNEFKVEPNEVYLTKPDKDANSSAGLCSLQ